MRKKLALIALVYCCCVLPACGEAWTIEEHVDLENADWTVVSMIQLIAHPEEYDGMVVRVQGFYSCRYEESRLYLSQDDRKYYNSSNSLWISDKGADKFVGTKYHGKYIEIVGTFDMQAPAHLWSSPGIIDIQAHGICEQPQLWESPFAGVYYILFMIGGAVLFAAAVLLVCLLFRKKRRNVP